MHPKITFFVFNRCNFFNILIFEPLYSLVSIPFFYGLLTFFFDLFLRKWKLVSSICTTFLIFSLTAHWCTNLGRFLWFRREIGYSLGVGSGILKCCCLWVCWFLFIWCFCLCWICGQNVTFFVIFSLNLLIFCVFRTRLVGGLSTNGVSFCDFLKILNLVFRILRRF